MIFTPTATSQAMIKAVLENIEPKDSLLDLGCGNGIIGGSLAGYFKNIYASDISQEAIDFIKQNAPYIDARQGNLFEPWKGMKFDIIIDDVSGISEEVAKVSSWFEGVPCISGRDGAKLVSQVLREAPSYLKENGKLFFPIVSLSDINKIKKIAEENFKIKLLSHTEFPLPKEMYKHIDLLKKLKEEGNIYYKERWGLIIFWTDIYVAEVLNKNLKSRVYEKGDL
jgi:methylase of polypeptide subunit release factors